MSPLTLEIKSLISRKEGETQEAFNKTLSLAAKKYEAYLDSIEAKLKVISKNAFQEGDLALGKEIENQLKVNRMSSQHTTLILKVASLSYRIGVAHGGDDPLESAATTLMSSISDAVRSWKKNYDLCIEKNLTQNDRNKIETLCRYPHFSSALSENKKIQDECFKLIFRDNFPIDILVQYFKTCSVDLKRAYLGPWVGLFRKHGKEVLTIARQNMPDGSVFKDLKFLINGKQVSILDDQESIQLNDGENHTWKKIKEIWALSSKEPARMALFWDRGMILWRSQGLSHPGGKVDTTRPKWWEGDDVPPFLMISKQDLESSLKISIQADKPYIATVEASSLDPLCVDDSHGACTLYIPTEGGNTYRVFPVGKYARNFPQNALDNVRFLANTVEADFTYPDPTPTYTQRIHGAVPHHLTKDQAEWLLTKYGKDVWYFQFAGNNCSAEHQLAFEELLGKKSEGGEAPNYFLKPLIKAHHSAPGTFLMRAASEFPKPLHSLFVSSLQWLLGANRTLKRETEEGVEEKSLNSIETFAKMRKIYIPGVLIYRILAGKLQGVVWFGLD